MTTTKTVVFVNGRPILRLIIDLPLDEIPSSTTSSPLVIRRDKPTRFRLPDGRHVKFISDAMREGVEILVQRVGADEVNRLIPSNVAFGMNERPLIATKEQVERLRPDAQDRYKKTVRDATGNTYYLYDQFSWMEKKKSNHPKEGAGIKVLRLLNENGVQITPIYDRIEVA